MASDNMRVDTGQVLQIASEIERLNGELSQQLTDSKTAIDNLANIWQGDAATQTVTAFDDFATKYFQTYEDIINQYVTFLKNNVSSGYDTVETSNVNLADSFN